MGVLLGLETDTMVFRTARILEDLQIARTALIKEYTQLYNCAHVQINAVLKRQTKSRLSLVDKQIAELACHPSIQRNKFFIQGHNALIFVAEHDSRLLKTER